MNKKRILAVTAIILLLLLYAATLIFALLDSPFFRNCLLASLFCTVVGPVIIYAYFIIIRYLKQRRDKNYRPQ